MIVKCKLCFFLCFYHLPCIVKILNLYIILLCTHWYHTSFQYLSIPNCFIAKTPSNSLNVKDFFKFTFNWPIIYSKKYKFILTLLDGVFFPIKSKTCLWETHLFFSYLLRITFTVYRIIKYIKTSTKAQRGSSSGAHAYAFTKFEENLMK